MLRTFSDGQLFGSVTGSGTPLVLALHGWGRTHRDFDAVVAPAGGVPLNAIALDLPGFGASPPPAAVWGAADYARAVGQVLADMSTPVVVLGHSYGGRVALHLAAQRPDAVHAMVLTGVPFLHPLKRRAQSSPAFRLVRRLHAGGLVSDTRMEAARQRYGSADYKAAQGIVRQILVRAVNETYEPELNAVQCPVHLVWGGDDTVVPVEVAQRAAARLAHSDLVVQPGIGHLTPTLIPGPLREAVLACLN